MKNKLIIVFIFFYIINTYFSKSVNAKYVYTNEKNIFKIQSADNTFPEINGRNYDVYDEIFNNNITVNFSDNLGIKYSKYWFKEENNLFLENDAGTSFENGFVFEKSGYYKIEVCDLYDNKTQYTFLIDKEVNKSEINLLYEDENQIIIENYVIDFISEIYKSELYKDGILIETYDYSINNTKEIFEEFVIYKTDINFYEEIYVINYDKLGNSKKTNSIYLNQDKIYDLDDLFRFNNIVNNKIDDFSGKIVYLMNNLDMSLDSTRTWNSIIDFKGEFDGNNCTISGFYMDTSIEDAGFFASNYGKIKDFTVIGEVKSSANVSAGICAENFGEIYNCRSKVTINSSGDYSGGIAGINYGTIELCKNNFDITINGNYAGGIVGYNKNTGAIRRSGSSGKITGKEFIGGVCGFTEGNETNIMIEQCFSMGTVKAKFYVGGICGGTSGKVNMNYLYNRGDVIELSNSGNSGGIVGYNNADISIKNSYNLGNINSWIINQIAPQNVTVTESYYILGRNDNSGNGIGKDEYLFKELLSNTESILYLLSQNTNNVWSIKYGYNDGYPLFEWQL